MFKITILDLLQQDIEDVKGIIDYEKYEMKKSLVRKQARAILLNLQDHLEEFVENINFNL